MTESRCLNCGAVLFGEWCARCGQRVMPVDPTWGELVREAADELLHVDGKVGRSVRLLLTRPGELTSELLRGRRAPYVSPLRLYLTASLVYFLLGAVLPNVDFNIDSGVEPPDEQVLRTLSAIVAAVPRAVFALVPFFAWLVRLMYGRVSRNYPAFLHFSLHVHAAFFTVMAVTVPLQTFASDLWISAAQLVVALGMFVYFARALRHVFGGTLPQALGRAAAIAALHMAAFTGVLAGLWFVFR